jgi:arsenite-transporting ATPase
VLDDMQAKHRYISASLGGRYRADAADALIDALAGQGQELGKRLRDPRAAAFSWVLLPERLALEEARDGVTALARAGIAVGEIVVNRVTPGPPGRCAHCAETLHAETAVLAAVRAAFAGRPIRVIPAETAEPRGLAALRRLARSLSARPAPRRRGLPAARGRSLARPPGDAVRGDAWLGIAVPPQTRLLLVAGKGGVGKTSCAATIALALAGRTAAPRILLLSTDPAHSLADALAVPLGDRARRVPGAPPGLRARELDAARAFQPIRERYRESVDRLFDSLGRESRFDVAFDREVARDLIDLAPPGLDELVAVLSMLDLLAPPAGRPTAYDVVVLDLAPTGHALRLLAMPEAALEWVRALLAVLLKYRAVVGLGDLAADLVETARGLRTLGALLRDPRRTRAVVVTRPAELPRLETARLLQGLRRLEIRLAALIVNAVTAPRPGCARCATAARENVAAIRALARWRHPLIVAPAEAPPPAGVAALRGWGSRWSPAP